MQVGQLNCQHRTLQLGARPACIAPTPPAPHVVAHAEVARLLSRPQLAHAFSQPVPRCLQLAQHARQRQAALINQQLEQPAAAGGRLATS